MANGDGKQMEIEIALRDSASSVLKDISKNIDELSRKLVETGRKGTEAFDKIKHSADEGDGGVKKATEHVSSLTSGFGKLGEALKGPVGVVAGIAATTIALERFISRAASSRLQLQLMTTDLGLSKDQINIMQQVLARKGIIDPGEQKRIITQFAGEAMDLKTRGVYSEFWERLQRFDPKFARSMKESVDHGDIYQSWNKAKNMYADLVRAGNPDLARYFATETLHMAESSIAEWDEYAKGITAARQLGDKEAKAAAAATAEAAKSAGEATQHLLDITIQKLLEWEKTVDKAGDTAAEAQKKMPPPPAAGGGTAPGGTFQNRYPGPNEFSPTPGTGSGTRPQIYITPRPGYGGSSSSEDPSIPAHAKPTSYSRDLLQTEKESTGILQDIRDLLEGPADIGGAAKGLTFRRGIRSGQRGGGGGGGGGPQESVGSVGAMGGTVHGHQVDPYGGVTGQQFVDPISATSLGGGVGGTSTKFGARMHEGVDLMAPENSPVVAPRAGTVTHVGKDDYGNQTITIDHKDGTFTRILHIRGVNPNMVGKSVGMGVQIGRSGYANAGHIHFEMWRGQPGKGTLMNPRAIYGWDKKNLPVAGTPRTGRGPQSVPTPAPRPTPSPQSFKGVTGPASFFNDRYTASGLGPDVPGFAIRSTGTLGQKFIVRDETTGKEIISTQTDWGPHIRTGRSVDINAPLAKMFGYPDEKHFPTGHIFSVRPIDGELGKSGAAGKTSSRRGRLKATVDFAGLSKRMHAAQHQPFKPLKLASGRQNQTVHAGSVLPGDTDHSRWTV